MAKKEDWWSYLRRHPMSEDGVPKKGAAKANSVCRVCKSEEKVEWFKFKWAAQPRCSACGGLLDKKFIGKDKKKTGKNYIKNPMID